MMALKVLFIIIAAFWLIGRIQLGGLVQYDQDGLLAKVIVGPLKITIFPRKELSPEEKAKKKARDKAKKAKAEIKKAKSEEKKARLKAKKAEKEAKWREQHPGQELPKEKKGGALPPFTKLLLLVAEAAGGMKKRIRIDELTLHLAWAAENAADAAIGYGRANAAMGMIWPLIDHNFNVKKHDLGVAIDFFETSPTIMCRAVLTIRLGQIVSFGLRLAFKFLSILVKSRAESEHKSRSTKKQEA